MVLTQNVAKELLSRAKILPAKFLIYKIQIGDLFEDIFSNIKNTPNNLENPTINKIIIKNEEKNYDLLDIFDQSYKDKINVVDSEQELEKLKHEKNEESSAKRQFFDLMEPYSQNKGTGNTNGLSCEFQLPSASNLFEIDAQKEKNIDLNDENFNLDFLKAYNRDKYKEEKETNDLQIDKNQSEMNKINEKALFETQNKKLKKENPLDFIDEFISSNKNNNNKKTDGINNSQVNELELSKIKSENPCTDTQCTSHFSNPNTNPQNFSYLNFNFENDENQKLLNSDQNTDPFGIKGIPGIAEQIIPGINNAKNQNPFDSHSINNIGDINDIFALSQAMENRLNHGENSNQVLEPSEYRKSLENNNLKNNKKKIEKLFYTESIINKFNLKINQEKYDGELIDIFLHVNYKYEIFNLFIVAFISRAYFQNYN